jgi:hypothetical protein
MHAYPGTTTATVLTRAIFSEGCKSVAAGMNPMDLRRGINLAVEKVLENLKGRAKMISTTEEIAQVRRVSLWRPLCSPGLGVQSMSSISTPHATSSRGLHACAARSAFATSDVEWQLLRFAACVCCMDGEILSLAAYKVLYDGRAIF